VSGIRGTAGRASGQHNRRSAPAPGLISPGLPGPLAPIFLEPPPISSLLSCAFLLVSCAALLGAGMRLASPAVASGLVRAVAAIVYAAVAALLQLLALGLLGLGGSAAALLTAAGLTWVGARALLPNPAVRASDELAAWWRGLDGPPRVALGAAVGVGAAYLLWLLRHPSLGLDGAVYHLTESVMWAQQGTPASIELVTYEFPVGNYPVVYELLIAWSSGIARTFPQAVAWTPLLMAVTVAAGWTGMRELEVSRSAAALALAAVVAIPVTVDGLRGPSTDVAALAWLTCAGALAAASVRRPALLAPCLLAAALAAGVKSTTLPYCALLLALAGWRARAHLRRLALPLGAAAILAAVVGGRSYFRNLVEHGSPFWPFIDTRWGDPIPPYIARFDVSFFDRPRATLQGRLGEYLDFLGGAPLLLACALLAAVVVRRRAVLVSAAATAAGGLIWARSPFTGRTDFNRLFDFSLSTTRYLLPVFAAAALTLALAARRGGPVGAAALGALAASTLWSLVAAIGLGYPRAPSAAVLTTGVVLGAAIGFLAGQAPKPSAAAVRIGGLAAAAGVALLLAATAPGFLERYARTGNFGSPVTEWLQSRKVYRDGSQPVYFAPAPFAVLAGFDLAHRIEVIPAREDCAGVRRRARRGFVVVRRFVFERFVTSFTADECLRGVRPVYTDGSEWRVYSLRSRRPAEGASDGRPWRSRPLARAARRESAARPRTRARRFGRRASDPAGHRPARRGSRRAPAES
jgi:hypothetical protein